MRNPVLAICEQQRCRSASAQSDQNLYFSLLPIQNFKTLAYVVEQFGLSLTRSKSPKTDFLVSRLIHTVPFSVHTQTAWLYSRDDNLDVLMYVTYWSRLVLQFSKLPGYQIIPVDTQAGFFYYKFLCVFFLLAICGHILWYSMDDSSLGVLHMGKGHIPPVPHPLPHPPQKKNISKARCVTCHVIWSMLCNSRKTLRQTFASVVKSKSLNRTAVMCWGL